MSFGLGFGFMGGKASGGIVVPDASTDITSPSTGQVSLNEALGSDFTIALDFTDGSLPTTNNGVYLTIANGTSTSNRMFLQARTSGAAMRWAIIGGSGGVTDPPVSSWPAGRHCLVVRVSTTDSTQSNFWAGAKQYNRTSFTPPSNLDRVDVNQLNTGTNNRNATYNRIRIWNEALTDAQCRAISRTEILTGVTKDTSKKGVAGLGQSNMVGFGGTTYPTYTNASKMSLLTNAMVLGSYSDPWDSDTNSKVGALDNPTNGQLGYMGYAANKYAGDTGNDIAVCPAARESTGFVNNSGGINATWSTTFNYGSGNDTFGASLMAAIFQLQLMKQYLNIDSIVFGQGEADAVTSASVTQQQYEDAYSPAIDELRLSIDQPTVPFIDATLPNYQSSSTILAAKQAVAATKANMVIVNNTDLTASPHFDASQVITVGERVGVALQSYIP